MEWLDHVKLLTDTDEFDRLSCNGGNGKSRAASGIAVKLREHDTRDPQGFIKGSGCVDSILTRHGVDHEEDFRRVNRGLDVAKLVHELLVNVQTAGRIKEDDVIAVFGSVGNRRFGDFNRIALTLLKHRNLQLRADGFKLLDGCRAVNVTRDKQRPFALLAKVPGKLCSVCGFARTLQAAKHHNTRKLRRDVDFCVGTAEERAKLFVDDLNNLLGGRKSFEHISPGSPFRHTGCKVLHNFIADIRLEKGHAHFAHCFLHIGLRQPAFPAQALENRIQFIGNIFKCHTFSSSVLLPHREAISSSIFCTAEEISGVCTSTESWSLSLNRAALVCSKRAISPVFSSISRKAASA